MVINLLIDQGGDESNVLQHAEVPVWQNADCEAVYLRSIQPSFMCAGYTDGGQGACQVKLTTLFYVCAY